GMAALGGWALVLAALVVLWRYHAVSWKQFGGITGDLAGWFLQKAELWMLAALCACQWGGLL
ncbi:adenosylcobinamide-GDP ribazoletransferase, partial [Faecalibacterium prausnitzii]